jgi:hypothetical protein
MFRVNRLIPPVTILMIAILACNTQGLTPTVVPTTPGVASSPTVATAIVPSLVASLSPTEPITPTDTFVPSTVPACDQAQFVSETVPDGTVFTAGVAFTKTWRLKNTGACTWTTSYAAVFDSGDALSAPAVVPFSGDVMPGQEVDVVVNMQTPLTPGTYTGYWRLRNATGVIFGLGPSGSVFLVKIVSIAPTATVPLILLPTIVFHHPFLPLFTPIQDVTHAVTITAGNSGSSHVACPADTILTGGGFSADADIPISYSYRDGNGWMAAATNTTSSDQSLTVDALCLPAASGVTSLSPDQGGTALAGNVKHLEAACPAGTVLTGGGYVIGGAPGDLVVYNSSADGSSWQIYARNNSASDIVMAVYAVCLSGASGATSQEVSSSASAPASGINDAQATCPSGSMQSGGGFAGNPSLDVFRNHEHGEFGWEVFVQNRSSAAHSFISYAICLTMP